MISDNEEIAAFFLQEFKRHPVERLGRLEFRYSAINRSPAALDTLGGRPLDVTDGAEIDWVVGTFDLVISAHCKKIFPKRLLEGVRCVNYHPGFNPFNRGWYPQVFSILNGAPLGTTVHVMTEEIDGGPIIAQRRVDLSADDTSGTAYRKVIEAEKMLIRESLEDVVSGSYAGRVPPEGGRYNSIADFKALCRLDLDQVGTLKEHLDLLRALSHPPFRNGYFHDAEGRKIFVALDLARASDQPVRDETPPRRPG